MNKKNISYVKLVYMHQLEALESKVEDMNDKEDNVLKTLEEGFKNASIREDLLQEQIKDLSEKVQTMILSAPRF